MEVDGNAVVTTGGVIGLLGGAIVFLFKILIDSKNVRINDLSDERDFWRDVVLKNSKINGEQMPDYEQWYQDNHPAPKSRERRIE